MSSPSTPLSGRLAAAALGLSLTAAPGDAPARADTLDPTMPRTVVVGPPRGAAPSDRLDPHRTGRARTRLPSPPVELWRRHVSGNVEQPPVVDADGNVLVALSVAEVVKLGPDARELWRARLGAAPAAVPPLLLADGTLVVLTLAGAAVGLTPGGALRFVTPLGFLKRDVVDTVPVALENGDLLIAAGNAVVVLDADGVVRARGAFDDRTSGAPERAAGAVIDAAGGALVTTASGGVYRFRPPAAPRKIGSLGGVPSRGALLADERTLVSIVDGRRVVALDLPTGTTHVRSSGYLFDAPPALAGGGLLLVATQLGMMLGIDPAGNERVHLWLDKPPQGGAAGSSGSPAGLAAFAAPADVKPSPPVVVDADGRIAFVRAGGRLGVVSPEGKVHVASERICATPVAVVPAGEKRLLCACRDGGLWMFGE
jgi:hypothetical protein